MRVNIRSAMKRRPDVDCWVLLHHFKTCTAARYAREALLERMPQFDFATTGRDLYFKRPDLEVSVTDVTEIPQSGRERLRTRHLPEGLENCSQKCNTVT